MTISIQDARPSPRCLILPGACRYPRQILASQHSQESAMKVDKSAQDSDLSSIPGEFRENYRFLSELINCKNKNDSMTKGLACLVETRLLQERGLLNRRQIRILKDYLTGLERNEPECMTAPVPAELEASIRVRKRSTWLPWEAEAIRKIDRWRDDVVCIVRNWAPNSGATSDLKFLQPRSKQSS